MSPSPRTARPSHAPCSLSIDINLYIFEIPLIIINRAFKDPIIYIKYKSDDITNDTLLYIVLLKLTIIY
jgi:hypothetical protein